MKKEQLKKIIQEEIADVINELEVDVKTGNNSLDTLIKSMYRAYPGVDKIIQKVSVKPDRVKAMFVAAIASAVGINGPEAFNKVRQYLVTSIKNDKLGIDVPSNDENEVGADKNNNGMK